MSFSIIKQAVDTPFLFKVKQKDDSSVITTHISDLGVGALGVVRILGPLLVRIAQLLVHTCILLGAPHTAVLWVGVLTEATVLPPHGAIVQCDCRGQKTNIFLYLKML